MAQNGYPNGGTSIMVLYKVTNSDTDADDPLFNAFSMPRTGAPTLATVKKHCVAMHSLNHLGPEGYHWRVCVEDRAPAGSSGGAKTYSWWDIQDENAKLPVKEASQSEIKRLFSPPKPPSDVTETATKAAKGAFKSFGKAVTSAVAGSSEGPDHGPVISVIAFKLLDLVKIHDDFNNRHGGKHVHSPQAAFSAGPRPPASASRPSQPPQHARPQQQPAAQPARAPPPRPPAHQPASEPSLLNFDTPSSSTNRKVLHHTKSSPASFAKDMGNANETRAERLKREYEQKHKKANRVWDDVDQRWVEVDPSTGGALRGTTSAPPGAGGAAPKKKVVGIKLDASNAQGKSANVQAGVSKRVNEMKESQQKAVNEVRAREAQKKQSEAEEDAVRKKLDPKIKAWSEEHGKKKQLRALLASLHTILWPEANWKQISIGDVLDDNKCKRQFHKASRVVHPDKTHHLNPEQRFLAKRIFDALSQAKTEFDDGKR